jgi:hypothetical protein
VTAVVPQKRILKFSFNRTRTLDVLVIAVQKGAKEIQRVINLCLPLAPEANISYFSKNSNSGYSTDGTVSVAAPLKKPTESTS